MTPPLEPADPIEPVPTIVATGPFLLDVFTRSRTRATTVTDAPGLDVPISESTTWMRIRSDLGVGVLVMTRDFNDLLKAPIGLYALDLDREALERLSSAIESTRWPDDAAVRALGQDGRPTMSLRYTRDPLLFDRVIHRGIPELAPLITAIAKIKAAMLDAPQAMLSLAVSTSTAGSDPNEVVIRVTLENRGRLAVVINDPRPRLQIKYRPRTAVDGLPHPNQRLVPVPPRAVERETETIRANGKLEIEIPWTKPGAGDYELFARWLDYGGPIEPRKGRVPFMPLPQAGASLLSNGAYAIRGAIFAAAVTPIENDR